MIKILGIPGSLRKGSFNKMAIVAAKSLVSDNADLEIYEDMDKLPPFNQDLENDLPEIVKVFKKKIKNADAILFSTPEYNFSIPGVLKNAIDWASRPYGDNSWEGKPVAVMGGSSGMAGATRAQLHLRQTFVFMNMFPINRPQVNIPKIQDKFDQNGSLNDKETEEKIRELLKSLVDWTIRLSPK